MTEAPERIWTQREFHQTSCRGSASTHETVRHAVGYIRADIHDAAVSAARKEGMLDMITTRLQHLIAWLEADDDNIYYLPVDDVQALRNWVNKKPTAETSP